jgi:nitrite reductase (NADH) large subunit
VVVLLSTATPQEEAIQMTARFMQYYQEHGKYLERTYDFVPRIGIEKLQRILVEDQEGLCAELDAKMQTYLDATFDPWVEDPKAGGGQGAYVSQFAPVRSVALPVLAGV